MSYRAALFDLDGTLLDTLEDIAGSTNEWLRERRLPEHPTDAFRTLVGDGLEVLIRRALPAAQRADEALVAAGVVGMRAVYARRWAERTRPYAGIVELLDGLTARGLVLAVLSNKADDFTKLIVARLLARTRFAVVLGARAGVPRKPDPTVALQIAARLGLPPAAFLYLGDTSIDMRTAGAAGMLPIGVSWGFRPAAELVASGAALILDRPAELLDWIDTRSRGEP